jgi:hypothetical protein
LFFVNPEGELVAARFDPAPGRVAEQETLFTLPAGVVGPTSATGSAGNDFYDVSSDGERFLMARSTGMGKDETGITRFVLVQNFFEELKRLVPN